MRWYYLTHVVKTAEGDSMIGFLRNENPNSITLQRLNDSQVLLPHSNVRYLQALSWLPMPPGLDAGFTPQSMADLLEYLFWPTATP